MNKPKLTINKLDNDVTEYNFEVPANFKLYRMRSNNNYSSSAFINDEIWGTTADSFNDPYDTTYIYNRKELFKYTCEKLMDEDELCSELFLVTDELLKKIANEIIDSLVNNNNTNRNLMAIACFTEKIDNEIMWAHYANEAKGFALEYSYYDLVSFGKECENKANELVKDFYDNFFNYEMKEERMPANLVPIVYKNKKYDITNDFKKLIDLQINNLKMIHVEKKTLTIKEMMIDAIESTKDSRENFTSFWEMYCLKKVEWSYEHEWRLLAFNLNSFTGIINPHFKMGYLKPTGIYLGEKMSEYDKKALIEIAKDKGIKIYQMYSKMTRRTNKLVYKELKY